MSLNRLSNHVLMANGISKPEHRKGSGYSISFRSGDDYNQFICSDCCTVNDDEETAVIEPYALDGRIFDQNFLESVNPSAKFTHLMNPEALMRGDGLFGEVMQHIFGETMEKDKKLNELMQSAQKRESDIKRSTEYTFYGRELSRMTGLEEKDMDKLIESIEPIKRSLVKITLREGITICFHYAR